MSYADLEERKSHLIRKALKGSCFGAPRTADPIETLTTTGGELNTLPESYSDFGWLTEEGMPFGRDVSQSDITSFGSTTPTRSDVTADTTTLTIIAQETKASTIALGTGADLAAIRAAAGTGEVRIDKPETPSAKYYRLLALAVDQDDTGAEIYIARFLPRAKVTGFNAQTYAGGDQAITWGVTFTAYSDSTLGFTESWLFGGPGWLNLLDDMGIEQESTGG